MNNNLPKGRETQHHYPTIFSRTTLSQTFLLFTLLRKERMRKKRLDTILSESYRK
jgi:hypothetical protein